MIKIWWSQELVWMDSAELEDLFSGLLSMNFLLKDRKWWQSTTLIWQVISYYIFWNMIQFTADFMKMNLNKLREALKSKAILLKYFRKVIHLKSSGVISERSTFVKIRENILHKKNANCIWIVEQKKLLFLLHRKISKLQSSWWVLIIIHTIQRKCRLFQMLHLPQTAWLH